MQVQEIQKHLKEWLQENPNPYIGINQSWAEYCDKNGINAVDTIGVLLATLQVHEIRVKQISEAVKEIQK